jgi:hypothetical protein
MSLLDKVSLCITPNAYKESKLYSVVPASGAGDMTVVRATTATRVNSSGLIEVVPRNFLTYSNDLSQSVWAKSNYTLSSTTSIQELTSTRITKNAINNGVYNGTGVRNVINTIGTFAYG